MWMLGTKQSEVSNHRPQYQSRTQHAQACGWRVHPPRAAAADERHDPSSQTEVVLRCRMSPYQEVRPRAQAWLAPVLGLRGRIAGLRDQVSCQAARATGAAQRVIPCCVHTTPPRPSTRLSRGALWVAARTAAAPTLRTRAALLRAAHAAAARVEAGQMAAAAACAASA